MKFKTNVLAGAVVVGLLMCVYASAQKVDYDFVPGTDFSKYKTYKWERATNTKYPGDGIDKMFMRTIDAELAKKGLMRVEDEPCDLFIIYQLAVDKDMEYSGYQRDGGWIGVNPNGLPGVPIASPGSTSVVRKGSMLLDIYDSAQKKLVWQAHATKTIKPTGDFMKNREKTAKVMAKILANYPPPAK